MNNTGNKVPSGAPLDFEDNCKTIDSVVNSSDDCVKSRTGKKIRTISGFNYVADKQIEEVRRKADGVVAQAGGVKIVDELGISEYDVLNQKTASKHILYSSKQNQLFGKFQKKLRIDGGAVINCVGTSNTANYKGKTGYPTFLGEALSDVYSKEVKINNLGVSGGTVSSLFEKWKDSTPTADLTIMEWVGNDQAYTDIDVFIQQIEEYIQFELDSGRAVFLMTSPKPTSSQNINRRIYSQAMYKIAEKYGLGIFDSEQHMKNSTNDNYQDAVHLNPKGNRRMAYMFAACFVGEGSLNPKIVSSGSSLLSRQSIDSIIFGDNARGSATKTSDKDKPANTPIEDWSDSKYDSGIVAALDGGVGKAYVYYSFFAETDNLWIVPACRITSGASIKILVDGGQGAPINSIRRSLHTLPSSYYNEEGVYSYTNEEDETIFHDSNNLYFPPIPIITRGWHTIKIEVEDALVLLYGVEFFNAMELRKTHLHQVIGTHDNNKNVDVHTTFIPFHNINLLVDEPVDNWYVYRSPVLLFSWADIANTYTVAVKANRVASGGWFMLENITYYRGDGTDARGRYIDALETTTEGITIHWKGKLDTIGHLSISVL